MFQTEKMSNLYFITYRVTNALTGGEFCNQQLLKGAERAGFVVDRWEGDRFGSLVKNIPVMNAIYLFKTLAMISGSFLCLDMDFHARYVLALFWAKYIKKAKIIGILYHYNYHDKTNTLSRAIHLFLERLVSKSCDYLITISKFSEDNFKALSARKIPIFINKPFSRNEEKPATALAHFNPEFQRLLLVGSIERRKNIVNTVQALAMLKTPFICEIVGFWPSAEYLKEVQAIIRTLGLEKKVFTLGKIDSDQLQKKYTSATTFVLVSKMEGYGMVYAEAMSYGLPIVGTTRGAVPEIVDEGENGFLCDPDNIDQIAGAIEKLFDREMWERISRNNIEKAKRFKSKEQFENESEDIFRSIISQ